MSQERDKKALADTVFLEARGESETGQDAVAHVIMNRARQNRSYFGGSNVADVCFKNMQFSCWNGRDKNLDVSKYPVSEQKLYKEIKKRTDAIYEGKGSADPTGRANHYHNPTVEPNNSWKDKCTKLATIGNHDFYTD